MKSNNLLIKLRYLNGSYYYYFFVKPKKLISKYKYWTLHKYLKLL